MSDIKTDEIPVPTTLEEANEIIRELRAAITNMDAVSQEGFDSVMAISRTIVRSLTAEGCTHNDIIDVCDCLRTIIGKSDGCMNSINVLAEEHFCNSKDIHARNRDSEIHRNFHSLTHSTQLQQVGK